MSRDFAFVQTAPGRIFVGWGPFEHLPFRRPDQPAFYVNDLFLDDVRPWRHPAEAEDLSLEEFVSRFEGEELPEIEWEPPSLDGFSALFESAQEAMGRGEFQKVVPILFESGRIPRREQWWHSLIPRLLMIAPGLRAYGYSYKQHGMIGATPEVLFEAESRGYRTMALAGTRPVMRAEELLASDRRAGRIAAKCEW